MPPKPRDEQMYKQVRQQIYRKYPRPSAYRSGLLVQAYKKRFKAKYGSKKPYIGSKPTKRGLSRWFKENWISDTGKYKYTSRDSIYRPSRRVTKNSPKTWAELSKRQVRCAKKEKARTGRVRSFASVRC